MSNWIVPCNVKHFDIFQHFKETDEVAFKRVGALRNGDIAYIYLSAPYSEVRFSCKVIDERMSEDKLKSHKYVIDKFDSNIYVLLKLEKVYEKGCLPLKALKENGLGQVQRQARADKELIYFIETNGVVGE